MAWTTPLTASAGVALTAAQWNASLRDNLLETAVAKATAGGTYFVGTGTTAIAQRIATTASVGTSETTASTTYTNLTTSGPEGVRTTGVQALVSISARSSNSGAGNLTYTSTNVNGSSTTVGMDGTSWENGGSTQFRSGVTTMFTGLTPGSNTFTMQYRVTGGTGTWLERNILVMPF